jgi:hypothetical protein
MAGKKIWESLRKEKNVTIDEEDAFLKEPIIKFHDQHNVRVSPMGLFKKNGTHNTRVPY